MSKRQIIGCVAILVLINALVAGYLILHRQSRMTQAEALFTGKVVRVSGSVETQGLVQEYREGKSILVKPMEEGKSPVLLQLSGNYRITIVAESEQAYRALLRQEETERAAQQKRKSAEELRLAGLDQQADQRQREEEATGELERNKLRREEGRVLMARGVGYIFRGNLSQAIESLYHAEELDADNFLVPYLIGLIKLKFGDTSGTVEYMSKTIMLKESYVPAYFFRGMAAAVNGDTVLAQSDLERSSNSFGFLQRISKKEMESGRISVGGGEIQLPKRKEGPGGARQMTINGKVREYAPVEGGGFMGDSYSPEELKVAIALFLRRTTNEEKMGVAQAACRSVFIDMQRSMEEEIKRAEKEPSQEKKAS